MTLLRPTHPLIWLALAAVALRLLLFLGRGDYVAFDEGWYVLLAQNLWSGEGYRLSGLRHVTLSPLFPILAGGAGRLIGDPVWGGRIVAAVAAGLLVLPCWAIFRRLAGRRTALLGCVFVAVLPSLAPFVVPFWIGWDLWVGAEPVLHLFLYTGIALFLRGLETRRALDWGASGASFALAYLARAEAVIPFGLLALAAAAVGLRALRPLHVPAIARAAAFGAAFVLIAAPYWLYLHGALGRWALTGRGVHVASALGSGASPASGTRETEKRRGPAATIERMLWDDDEIPYVRRLYGLDPSGTRLLSEYWGIPDSAADAAGHAPRREGTAGPPDTLGAGREASETGRSPGASAPRLYLRALGVVFPWFLWPFAVLGFAVPRRRMRRAELVVSGPLAVTSLLIAGVVAVDPRTQLFLAPILALYAARGLRATGVLFDRRVRAPHIRRRFLSVLLAATAGLLLLGTDARRLYLSLTVGSPHHILGEQKRIVGERLRTLLPPDEPVMSWHPAVALHARRDWRVLPWAPLGRIARYADAQRVETLVFSAYHPSPWAIEEFPRPYLILRVGGREGERGTLELHEVTEVYVVGSLRPE